MNHTSLASVQSHKRWHHQVLFKKRLAPYVLLAVPIAVMWAQIIENSILKSDPPPMIFHLPLEDYLTYNKKPDT
jgi:hypothetical protein